MIQPCSTYQTICGGLRKLVVVSLNEFIIYKHVVNFYTILSYSTYEEVPQFVFFPLCYKNRHCA
jgi:hypothetical protein